MDSPQCPQHGSGGIEADQTLEASVIRYGVSSPSRPRQFFLCRFELLDGTRGEHRFREVIPKLKTRRLVCPRCGAGLEDWNGEQVLERHWFPAVPIANCLSHLADGYSYRKAAATLRAEANRSADVSEPRRNGGVYRLYSDRPSEAQWLTETWAPILHQALAPQAWPEGGILALDALRITYSGAVKKARFGPAWMSPVVHDLDELLDPDDPEDVRALKAFQMIMSAPPLPKGTQGGLPCWYLLAAYGYERDPVGGFPRDQQIGKPWLYRAYPAADSLTWAHFLRQLPGRPAYVLSDMASEIRVGVELAWPDPRARPEFLTCEWHVTQALKRRVKDDPALLTAADKVFQTWGRRVAGAYDEHIGNGKPGGWRRLWHFAEFRRLARVHGYQEFDARFATPTWRRIMDQVVAKDGSLRYSTGALEKSLVEMAGRHIVPRGELFTNRRRTDQLLMLLQLGELRLSSTASFLTVMEKWIRENGTPKQSRRMDPSQSDPTLRRPLDDAEFVAVGLPTRSGFKAWMKKRHNRMSVARRVDQYHRDPAYRKKENARRALRLKRNDPQNTAHKRWLEVHADDQRTQALQRKAAAKAKDPERYLEQRRLQSQRHRERARQVTHLERELGVDGDSARELLQASDWDVDAALTRKEAGDV